MRTSRMLSAAAVLAAVFVLPGTAAAADDLSAPTSVTPVTGTATAQPSDPNPPTLVGVRTGLHEQYDRTVFDFTGGTPGYRVEYAPLVGMGTGNPIPLNGAATLSIVFAGAFAYDLGTGAPSIDLGRVYNPGLPTLLQIKSGGAFEGRISFGLGLADRVGFRVLQLTGPPRIAVDVAHQPTQPFGTTAFQGGAGTAAQVQVAAVRSGAHPGYDRVVFDLGTATTPSIAVSYAPTEPAKIQIGFTPATTQPGTVAGPNPVLTGLAQARSVSLSVNGNGTVSASISTDHRTGFRVMLLDNPTRVVVDVAY